MVSEETHSARPRALLALLCLACVFGASLPAAELSGHALARSDTAAAPSQDATDQAVLQELWPDVQWAAAATDWVPVPGYQIVQVGDRVRTGAVGAARLTYADGGFTELMAQTGILVQRLNRGDGSIVATSLWQSAGTSVHTLPGHGAMSPGDTAQLEVQTPSATVLLSE